MPETRSRYHTVVPDIEYYERQIKCQYACPVKTPAGQYVTAISKGNFEKAAALARGTNPFAQICGRVCAAPCQTACRRGSIDDHLQIRILKRYAMEYEQKTIARQVQTGKKVAIVGSGPAGMSAAHYLACRGYRVTIIEVLDRPSGMFMAGIPRYRLPEEIIEKDVEAILNLGVEVRTGVKVGDDLTIDDLKNEGFEAVILAVGAQLSRKIPLEGLETDGVLQGIEVMRDINVGKPPVLGQRVIVVGGGNVALDVARSIVRLGNKEVHITCLEAAKGTTGDPREEMPADQTEVDEGMDEGIIFHCSVGPRKIMGKEGSVTGLLTVDVKKVFDEDGRFNPTFIDGSESVIDADNVVLSIGQVSDVSFLSAAKGFRVTRFHTLAVEQDTLYAFVPGMYAAGDLVTGPRIAIDAIGQGKAAAQSVDEYLKGKGRKRVIKKATMTQVPSRSWLSDYISIPQQKMPILDVETRKKSLQEVEQGFSENLAMKEASRCLQCMVNPVFDGSKCILCGGCVDVCPSYCLKMVSVSDIVGNETLKKVILNQYGISLDSFQSGEYRKKLPQGTSAMIKDEEKCIRCGLCESRCPTGAVTMEFFEVEPQTEGAGAVAC